MCRTHWNNQARLWFIWCMCHESACETQCEAGKQDVNIMNVNGFFVAERHTLSYSLGFFSHAQEKWKSFFFGISDATAVNDSYKFGQRPLLTRPHQYKWRKLDELNSLVSILIEMWMLHEQSSQKHNDIQNSLRVLAFDREEKQDSHQRGKWTESRFT